MSPKKLIVIIMIGLIFSGCAREKAAMDQLSDDGTYYYQNKDLGFALTLPAEFEYYQTQRRETPEFIDIEIFVPTSDRDYPQEIQSYAKPIIVRMFSQEAWQTIGGEDESAAIYKKVGAKGNRVYTIRFWRDIPGDWQNKWSRDMEDKIKELFKLI